MTATWPTDKSVRSVGQFPEVPGVNHAVAVYHDGGGRDESRNDAGVRDSSAARWEPFAIHVLESRAGRLSALTHFIGAGHFAEFGLPAHLP